MRTRSREVSIGRVEILLETARLALRRLTEADVDDLVALDDDPRVMRFITGGLHTPPEVVRGEFLPSVLRYYERGHGLGFWAVVERRSGSFLGWLEFRPVRYDDPAEVELGYRLRHSAWGRGYAAEGARALIDRGFGELGVRRVFATTMTVNTASRRVMDKCGLTFVRTFFQDWPYAIEGSEQGDVEYELLKADWERRGRHAG
ncbi:GNAT family N-acetyltransferase [Microbispora sp. NPDC049125]|uniref:GNAT family N-acetyltransferase n=1 Tax=Microbispora sp. NPDC049125 TaxID=3154929 RepID=UPI0034650F54